MEAKMDLSEVEKSSDQVRPREVDEADNTVIDAEEIEEPMKSGRGMAMDYAELETLSDYPSALEYMKDQLPEYNLRYKRETERGRKEYYHCAGYLKCPKVIYILLHCESFECSIFQSVEDHSHNSHASRIPKAVQDLVRNCIDDNVIGNKRILQKLRDLNMPQITVKQLNNLKARMKEKKLGKSNNNLSELIKWCEERKEIPTEFDMVFCGGIEYELDDDDQLVYLRVFVTTVRLLQQMKFGSKILATDGTYKLNYNGYPILMVGTVDMDREYHPYGIMITKTETAADYPVQAKNVPIGQNRRRGRPRLTAAALEYQYNEYVDECVFSDTDSDSEKPPPKKLSKRKKPDPKSDSDSDYDVFVAAETVLPSTSKSCIVITQKKAAKTAKAPVKSSAKPPTRTLETRASKKAKLNVA